MGNETTLADDILDGMKAIAQFLGHTERRAFYLAEKGWLPGVFKQGNRWIGLKSEMRAAYINRSRENDGRRANASAA